MSSRETRADSIYEYAPANIYFLRGKSLQFADLSQPLARRPRSRGLERIRGGEGEGRKGERRDAMRLDSTRISIIRGLTLVLDPPADWISPGPAAGGSRARTRAESLLRGNADQLIPRGRQTPRRRRLPTGFHSVDRSVATHRLTPDSGDRDAPGIAGLWRIAMQK